MKRTALGLTTGVGIWVLLVCTVIPLNISNAASYSMGVVFGAWFTVWQNKKRRCDDGEV